ncbi:MAG: mandelate racemase/muconate lactonizing enzyme family protein [Acidobacteriota bacterium]|jgi:galactonate dehydratase
MKRRAFLQSTLMGAGGLAVTTGKVFSEPSDMKITRVRVYNPTGTSGRSGWLNHSAIVVTVETDAGITGIGQGGTRDMIQDCAGAIIGQDPFRTEYLWQRMYRGTFYPPGREKLHALGALDCALWDIKGKTLDAPVYQLLGGRTRNHIECYQSYGTLDKISAKAAARRVMDLGFRAIRFHGIDPEEGIFDHRKAVDETAEICAEVRAGVGPDGDWILDAHTRFILADAVRLCKLIEPLNPLFVEDPLRAITDPGPFRLIRQQVSVPIAAGEQFGDRWDGTQPLVEQGLIDYLRVAIPNVGGITEYMKIAALCETHYIGLVPHFTAPVATAAVAHAVAVFPGPVLNEVLTSDLPDYLEEGYDFRNGKIYPNNRPGIGVVFNQDKTNLIDEITQAGNVSGYSRPDGSFTTL